MLWTYFKYFWNISHWSHVKINYMFPNSWFIASYFLTWVTRPMPLDGQGLFTLPKHLTQLPFYSGVRVAQYLVFCVLCWVVWITCLSFCPSSFDHDIACPPSTYNLWLLLWYLQTFLIDIEIKRECIIVLKYLYINEHCLIFDFYFFCSWRYRGIFEIDANIHLKMCYCLYDI